MLTGAARAARKAGVLDPVSGWLVAAPVLVLLVLERFFVFGSFWLGCFCFGCFSPLIPPAFLLSGNGPWCFRTAMVAVTLAASGFALVWTIPAVGAFVREVRRRGRRLLLTSVVTGRLVLFSGTFLFAAYAALSALQIPTAGDVMARVKADFMAQRWDAFEYAVAYGVPGIRGFCREGLDLDSRPHRLMAAAGLRRLVPDSKAARACLRTIDREEFLDPQNRTLMFCLREVTLSSGGWFLILRPMPRDPEERWRQFRAVVIE
jgi:hypothetical protein